MSEEKKDKIELPDDGTVKVEWDGAALEVILSCPYEVCGFKQYRARMVVGVKNVARYPALAKDLQAFVEAAKRECNAPLVRGGAE